MTEKPLRSPGSDPSHGPSTAAIPKFRRLLNIQQTHVLERTRCFSLQSRNYQVNELTPDVPRRTGTLEPRRRPRQAGTRAGTRKADVGSQAVDSTRAQILYRRVCSGSWEEVPDSFGIVHRSAVRLMSLDHLGGLDRPSDPELGGGSLLDQSARLAQ